MSNAYIVVKLDDLELICEFDYTPGTPDVMTLPNGDPGFPGDAEELAIGEIWLPTSATTGVELSSLITSLGDDAVAKIEEIVREALHREQDKAEGNRENNSTQPEGSDA